MNQTSLFAKWFLAVFMTIFSFAPTSAWKYTHDGLTYEIRVDGTAELVQAEDKSEVIIPDSLEYGDRHYKVTSIGESCFKNCRTLSNINLPSSITSLGDSCFSYCTSLTSINLPSSITSLGESCFEGCTSLTSINLPSSITSLGDCCFLGCHLESINLPSGVTSLGRQCFSFCPSLTSINLPSSITSLGSLCFYNSSSLTSINLPSSITSLGQGCFANCFSLTSINLPSSITSLVFGCFQNCKSLRSINLPSSITSLDAYCFSSCSSLSYIELPASLSTIYFPTFDGTEQKKTIFCNSTLPPRYIGVGDCDECIDVNTTLYVPAISEDKYRNSEPWAWAGNIKGVKILLSNNNINLNDGGYSTEQTVTIIPAELKDERVIWTASGNGVALVDAMGNVMALNPGVDTLRCTLANHPGIYSECLVTVDKEAAIKVTGITLSKTTATLQPNDTLQLETTQTPSNATNKRVKWSSSNNKIATVNSNGMVTAVAVGMSRITATAVDGSGITADCLVTVQKPTVKVTSINLSQTTATLLQNNTLLLKATVYPTDASNKSVKWSSSNTDVAMVTSNGLIQAIAEGNAVIIATATDGSDVKAYCIVFVTGASSIDQVTMKNAKLTLNGHRLTVSGVDDGEMIYITNTQGCTVYHGTERTIDLPVNGVYIVKMRGNTTKICVK